MNDFNADNISIINNFKKSAKQSERQLTTRNAKITYKLKCKKNYLLIFLSVTLLLNTYFVKLFVRKHEAIYCLIGFGIGVSCCLLYEFIKKCLFSRKSGQNKVNRDIEPKIITIDPQKPRASQYIKKKFQIEDKLDYISFKYCKKSKTLPSIGTGQQQQQQSNKQNDMNLNCEENTLKQLDSDLESDSSGADPVLVYDSQFIVQDQNSENTSNYDEDDSDDDNQAQYDDANIINATDKLMNTNLNDEYNSAEKGFDKALDHIDKLKQQMSHLCTDIDLLYKSTTSKTDNEDSEDDASDSVESSSKCKDDVLLLDDLLDWNMHDVFNVDDVSSATPSTPMHYDTGTHVGFTRTSHKPFRSVINKYCRCCRKKLKIRAFYSARHSKTKMRKSCSTSYFSKKKQGHSTSTGFQKSRSSNSQINNNFNTTNINCKKIFNFTYN